MSTFCVVNDDLLVQRIMAAQWCIVLIAPGIHAPVAEALAVRLRDLDTLRITLVLDGGEDVCRIGLGEIAALKRVHQAAVEAGVSIRSQPGLRIGALIADDETIIWAPTARSVEAMPAAAKDSSEAAITTPNGLLLDLDVGHDISTAIGAEGFDTRPDDAEIGKEAITPVQVAEVDQALRDNPPIPIDLQRITRVFSTKLQFVELEVRGAKLSRRKLTLSSALINADADDLLREMLDSGLRPFADFKDRPIEVPIFVRGEQAFDKEGSPLQEPVSEAQLNRERSALEADFLYTIGGFGTLIEKDRKAEFQQRLDAYRTRMEAHAEGVRKLLQAEMETVVEKVVTLITERGAKAGANINHEKLRANLLEQIAGRDDAKPFLRCVFKDVTHEQTQDPEFRHKVDRALPASVKKRLGGWYIEFSAAQQGTA